MEIKVYHCKTADNWKERNQIDYWNSKSTVSEPIYCPDCGQRPCGNNDIVGAHVRKVYGDNKVYIAPVCRKCNSAGATDNHSFYIDAKYLVALND